LPVALLAVAFVQGIVSLVVEHPTLAGTLRVVSLLDLGLALVFRRAGQRRLAAVETHVRQGREVEARVVSDTQPRAGLRRLEVTFEAAGRPRRAALSVASSLPLLEGETEGGRFVTVLVHPEDPDRVLLVPGR
jgi:hypothetical protein